MYCGFDWFASKICHAKIWQAMIWLVFGLLSKLTKLSHLACGNIFVQLLAC
jgi:hypothetical protein